MKDAEKQLRIAESTARQRTTNTKGRSPTMNRFAELVGCRFPLQQAGMSGTATPPLAAAVANAGGARDDRDRAAERSSVIERYLDEVDALTTRRSAATCIAHFVRPEVVELVASRLPIIEFFYEWPDAARVPENVICGWQVGSVDEAKAAVDAGCQYVIAQGMEAGGHVAGMSRLPSCCPPFGRPSTFRSWPPVVSAMLMQCGAAMAMGADAVRVGTRFVATRESYAHPDVHRRAGECRKPTTRC